MRNIEIYPWNPEKFMHPNKRGRMPIQLHSMVTEYRFQGAIWPIIALGQAFGLMPLTGISSRLITDVKFQLKSKRTIYSFIVMMIILGYASFVLWKTLSIKISFKSIVIFLYYGTCAFAFTSFFVLAQKWTDLMKHWENVELNSTTILNYKLKKSKMLKLRIIAFTLLILAFVEHFLYMTSAVHAINAKNVRLKSILVPNLFDVNNNITTWRMLPFLFMDSYSNFVWNYSEIFIIIISIGLSTLFELLNYELEQASIENLTSEFWLNIRSRYRKLCNLVFIVDEHVSHIILVSFATDMIVICDKIFRALRYKNIFSMHGVNFIYSATFIIVRTFVMAFSVAQIHDESKKPIRMLLNVPSNAWTSETKALNDEVHSNLIALSGMEFFYLTRKLILGVVGIICTYELVLMQLE